MQHLSLHEVDAQGFFDVYCNYVSGSYKKIGLLTGKSEDKTED